LLLTISNTHVTVYYMEETIKILKSKGIKITTQRAEVFNVLAKSIEHLTIDEIFEKVHKKYPMISLATVYSILDAFKTHGLVQEIRILPEKACYNNRVDLHHHFYCRKCKKIFDIDIPFCATLGKKEVNGHMIEECQGNFYGICQECKK
jgi:Fur family transcriptional regulator, peroxide stress response regulator